MATRLYNRVVTDGLVLYLDAGNPKSYPGSGNVWYDLSDKSAHMVLYNGPTFTSNGEKSYIQFDGSNDYGLVTVQVPDSATGDRCCFECWCYGPMLAGAMLMSWGTSLHDIYIYNNGIGFNSYNSDVYGVSTSPLINTWVHFTVNFYRNNYTLGSIFVNGVQQSLTFYLGSQNTSKSVFAGGVMRIAAGGDGYYGNWRFNSVKVYNRALSSTEILQNYNATKSRYGLS